ncbi:MAG: methyltransferase domain-containing protein [Candidatus Polarisedimenticolia bacterium]
MRPSLPDLLACPACHGRLSPSARDVEDGEIMAGELRCAACAKGWPIRGGVPRFVETLATGDEARTARAFGWEWQVFSDMQGYHERQFLDWIDPVRPESFRGRVVLEGGCGKGRHTTLVGRWGARAVIGVDLSDAVDVAYAHTRGQPNVHIVQADLRALPLGPGSCDHAFSVGVLHHLPDPLEGFRSLARAVKPGGEITVWVYGAEGNGWIRHVVTPVRRTFTSRLPPPVLYPLSWMAAIPLWVALRTLYHPAARRPDAVWGRLLPYRGYLSYISGFPFREIHHIVHDHLAAPVAFYLRRDELEEWYRGVGARRLTLAWHNQNSWRAHGEL